MSSAVLKGLGVTLCDVKGAKDLKFDDFYATNERLRSGSYGTVYTCQHKSDPSQQYAVKILDRTKLKKSDDAAVFREVDIMKELVHLPNVVRLMDFFVSPEKLFMVQVLAKGGDVFDRLSKRTAYNEKDARDLAETLLETIRSLHDLSIVHRDLKPENLLLAEVNGDSNIMLADFGFARHVSDENLCKTRCGTPAYVAPEIILGVPYSTKCDLWSIGCLLYMLIGGYPPFQGTNHRELFRKVRAADYVFHDAYWKKVSVPAKRLISSLLVPNPLARWDCNAALQCDWFQQADIDSLRSTDLSSSLDELRKFRPRRTWKSTVQALRFAANAPFWNTDTVSFTKQLINWDKNVAAEDGSGKPSVMSSLPTVVQFHDVYKLKHKLRKGSYATVWECVHKETQEVFAVKIIMRQGLDPKDDEAVLNEVSMMQSLHDNEYVVQLSDFYEENDYFYLVMENMTGGDVFDRIVQMQRYTEKDARDLVVRLLKAVDSMHKQGIVHRDIKPQNLLLRSTDDHADIKIADFGFARRVHTPESLTSRCGTPSYVAPEILKNIPHDNRVDLWSIGVVIYVLLVGYPPFMENDQAALFRKIRSAEYEFPEDDWAPISDEAIDLIKGLLVLNPKERWTIRQCLRCKWLRQDSKSLSEVDLGGSVRQMKGARNRLRLIARAILFLGNTSKTTDEVATKAPMMVDESGSQKSVEDERVGLV